MVFHWFDTTVSGETTFWVVCDGLRCQTLYKLEGRRNPYNDVLQAENVKKISCHYCGVKQ